MCQSRANLDPWIMELHFAFCSFWLFVVALSTGKSYVNLLTFFFYSSSTTMSAKIHQSDSERVGLSQASLRNMDLTQPRNAPIGYTNLASLKVEDDDLSSQDNYSLASSTQSHGNPHDLSWSMSDADAFDNACMHKPESPEVQMLSFCLSQQQLPSTVGPSDVMYQAGAEFQPVQDFNDHSDMDFSQAQDFVPYSAFVDFSPLENNDSNVQSGADDSLSVGHGSHTEAWNSMMGDSRSYHRSSLDGISSSLFNHVPVSPPLTEASNDFSISSSCSQSGYPAFMSNDDAMLKDITATPSLSNHGINLGDPIFPVSPPLNEDMNR